MSDIPVILHYPLEDYTLLWAVNVQGRKVLDIGADRGSTASFFLRNGASKVICVEGDPEVFAELQANLPALKYAEAVCKYIQNSFDLEELLRISADVVKIDVEGAEQYLYGVAPWVIKLHSEYLIEIHTGYSNATEMSAFFQQLGYNVTMGAMVFPVWRIIHCKLY